MELADFQRLSLPLPLAQTYQPQFKDPSPSLLYRCRYLLLSLAIWPTLVAIFVFDQPEKTKRYDNIPFIFLLLLALVAVIFYRAHFSDKRVTEAISLWTRVSHSIAYLTIYISADLRHSNRPQSVAHQLETTVVGILEELTVTLGICKRPEIRPAVPNNDDASVQPGVVAEEPLQEIPPILQQLASYKSGCFPQIPSTRAPGMSDEAQKLLSKLKTTLSQARDSTELNQDFRAEQCEAEIVTLETYLDNLAWFLPSQYIAQSWAFAALFCFGMPLLFPNEGWFLVPGTLIVSGTLILFLVHSDDNEHLVNLCNKPCGLASIDNAPATLPESRVLAALYHRPQAIDSKFLRSWQLFRAIFPARKTKEAINETSKSTSV